MRNDPELGVAAKQELWRRAEALFQAALERPPDVRGAFLDRACGDDVALRRQIDLLLSHDQQAGSFLEKPLLAGVASPPGNPGALVGREYGSYRIVALLGAGGMGEVYRAHDTKLERDVAIKTLPRNFVRDPAWLARLRREARTLASLNHPNIAAIYGLEESPDAGYLVLELVEGETPRGPVPVARALDLACQIAEALQAAHEHGIVHRDLKPANLRVTPQGTVKVLDFGLAKAMSRAEANEALAQGTAEIGAGTMAGRVVGTPGYMSPEQARGGEVDHRTDIWAFGCLLFELLAGKRAFASQPVSDIEGVVEQREPDWRALPRDTPSAVHHLLRRCLQADANLRPLTVAAIRSILERARRRHARWRLSSIARRPALAVPAAAIVVFAGLLAARMYNSSSRTRWVREQAVPEIARLLESGDRPGAFRLIRRAKAISPDDPAVKQLLHDRGLPVSFETTPPGAEVWATGYAPDDSDWLRLGTTPFTTGELLPGLYRFRVVKPGFQGVFGAGEVRGGTSLEFDLDAEGSIPPDMVRVPGATVSVPGLDDVRVSRFLIDRHEITNRQFKQFVDRGGYLRREYWTQEFVRDGRTVTWDDAMQVFRDSTGRPGPSTWTTGAYPEGHDEYPVTGVSWFEAAAYAEYAGKRLPTIYHWQSAARPGFYADIAELSNFSGTGPARVGSYSGIGAFGTLDMAGNAREWCWNEVGNRRYIRGGAWNEAPYMFSDPDARSPWDRSAQNGIRLVRYDARGQSGLEAPVATPARDFTREKPARDDVFALYQNLYAYDHTNLDSRTEGIDEENADWRREKISFAAPYATERVGGYLYIPKHASPPYQAIIYADPGMALRLPAPYPGEEFFFSYLVKAGRAFLVPVLKGHYQRRYNTPAAGPNEFRDRLIIESKDFRRSIDYLVSRPDVDPDRLGVYGVSRGGCMVPVLAVGERRLKAAVLLSVGLTSDRVLLPEDDPFNFVPRLRIPTLMGGGRSDFIFPVETSQRPMFQLLGTPEPEKRLILWDGGHVAPGAQRPREATLEWFDRYLGPVK